LMRNLFKRLIKINHDINMRLTYLFLDSDLFYQKLKCPYKEHASDNS
jgi:hypothetical protein